MKPVNCFFLVLTVCYCTLSVAHAGDDDGDDGTTPEDVTTEEGKSLRYNPVKFLKRNDQPVCLKDAMVRQTVICLAEKFQNPDINVSKTKNAIRDAIHRQNIKAWWGYISKKVQHPAQQKECFNHHQMLHRQYSNINEYVR
ncbi:hypothetical protein WDU94_006379 [Cyamophila willieti]